MVEVNQSTAILTGVPFSLIDDVFFKPQFLHFYEIFMGLTPVVESRIPGMRIPKFGEMDLARILIAIHAKIDRLFFTGTDPDPATPLTATLLFVIFRSTSHAGFLIGRTGTTPNPAGG
jgi:hypothetical protein